MKGCDNYKIKKITSFRVIGILLLNQSIPILVKTSAKSAHIANKKVDKLSDAW